MNNLNRNLNTVRNTVLTFFIVRSIFYISDYIENPEIYEIQSTPWYTAMLLLGIFTFIVVVICSVIKIMFKCKSKNMNDNSVD